MANIMKDFDERGHRTLPRPACSWEPPSTLSSKASLVLLFVARRYLTAHRTSQRDCSILFDPIHSQLLLPLLFPGIRSVRPIVSFIYIFHVRS
uniref:Uncharacterized protein n=1 Tax=Zea mays TaxID=4577 RepID=A0A804U838_MAIZE